MKTLNKFILILISPTNQAVENLGQLEPVHNRFDVMLRRELVVLRKRRQRGTEVRRKEKLYT